MFTKLLSVISPGGDAAAAGAPCGHVSDCTTDSEVVGFQGRQGQVPYALLVSRFHCVHKFSELRLMVSPGGGQEAAEAVVEQANDGHRQVKGTFHRLCWSVFDCAHTFSELRLMISPSEGNQ